MSKLGRRVNSYDITPEDLIKYQKQNKKHDYGLSKAFAGRSTSVEYINNPTKSNLHQFLKKGTRISPQRLKLDR